MGFVLPLARVARAPSSSRRREELHDADEFAYLLTISVGNQQLPVILDTGSSDLWIASTECASATGAGVATYNASLSRSFANSTLPFELRYLEGNVRGAVAWETVVFGSYVVARQALALVSTADALDLAHTRNSGILGLAFGRGAAIASRAGAPLLDNVLAHVGEDERFFGVRLARDANGSSFAVGRLDPAVAPRAAEIAYTAVFPTAKGDAYDFWKLPLHHLVVDLAPGNGSAPLRFELAPSKMPNAPPGANIAVLDTGTTLMLGPAADVSRFYALLGGAARQADGGLWEVQCARRVGLALALGDAATGTVKEYPVHPVDVSWAGERYLGWCLGGIQVNDGVISGDWLLGDTFLRNVYVTHRPQRGTTPPTIGLLSLTDPVTSAQEFAAQRGEDASAPCNPAQAEALSRRPQHRSRPSHALPLFGLALGIGVILGAAAVLVYAWRAHGRLPAAARRRGKPRKKIVLAD